ncbi:MAG TPA: redoxin family protein [Saprospiraceae bacterium]|nr:redoxin family protein [Saprospiraceae bacterium]
MTKQIQSILFILFLFGANRISGQLAPDFTITDSEGDDHTLYADYLNQGKTVLIEIFFTTCPPCNAIAPYMEPLYQEWGGGDYDVEFFDLSDKNFDTDALVNAYKANHGHTYPAAGSEGGSLAAVAPYKQGMFGPFYGTPTFVVIAPDGTVQYDVDGSNNTETIAELDAAIAATGAQRPECLVTIAVYESFCTGDSVEVYEQWYDEAGTYTDTIQDDDCDTLVWITITEDPLEISTINASFCAGESVVVYGTNYDEAGTYEVIVQSQTFGCDTVVTVNITMDPLHTNTINASFTEGDSVLVYGVWYNEENTYMFTVQSLTGGCDTLVTLHIIEIPDIPTDVTISGVVRTHQGSVGIAGARMIVSLNGNDIASDTTDAQGRYEFVFDSAYVVNNDLRLSVSKTINPLNGLTVLDLVALQKHLLGLEYLNSVEKLFAADVNLSKTISVLDIVYMRRLLLGFENQFPSPSTWLFFHASVTFGAPGQQPPVVDLPVPVLLQNILNGTQSGTFRGIKLGDLNNTANPLN